MNITSIGLDTIELQVTFENPSLIGITDDLDILSVYVDFADIDPTFYGQESTKIGQVAVHKLFSLEAVGTV